MQIIGHRGARGLAPENTITGIKFALTCNVDWIEFDVHASKDGQLVVVHDTTLGRITHKRGRVRNFSYAELKQIATKSGEPIPTFEEVMKVIGKKAKINIEIKSRGCAETVVANINKQVSAGRPTEDFLVSSFKTAFLREVHGLAPYIRLSLLHDLWPFKFMHTFNLPLVGVGFHALSRPSAAIKIAKSRGLWTYVYTINTQATAKKFEEIGIDAIVTDVPENFKQPRFSKQVMQLFGAALLVVVIVALYLQFIF